MHSLICNADTMKKKKNPKHKHFFLGAGVTAIVLLTLASFLFSTGYLNLGINSLTPEESYANSLSPRKNTSTSIYTRPTPDPAAPDQTAPTISFISPLNGSTVDTSWKSGAYYVQPIEVAAYDNDRIMVVYIFVNDILDGINVYNSTSYKQNVRIPTKAGTYTIKALGYDYNNNEGTASITLTVPGRK